MPRRNLTSIDSEISVIDGHIDKVQQRENDVTRLLEDLTRLRDSLSADKRALLEQRNDLQAQKSPINWLPAELLIQIFVLHSESEHEATGLYHKPPVILSHVCVHWRRICLNASRLWSRISHSSTDFSREALSTFIHRAKNHSLTLVLQRSSHDVHNHSNPDNAALYAISELRPHFSRLESIVFRCNKAVAMEEIVDIINDPICNLSRLYHLTLAMEAENPYFLPSLLGRTNLRRECHSGSIQVSRRFNSSLRDLCLHQVPLFNIPPYFLPSVVSLELHFPPSMNHALLAGRYVMHISELRRFLALMPQLRELVLSDTVPTYDVPTASGQLEPGEILDESLQAGVAVELARLQSLEWSYPHPADVHRFLAHFAVPSLAKLDIYLDGPMIEPPEETRTWIPRVVQLDWLQELRVLYVDDDSLKSALRRLELKMLVKVEIANVDPCRRCGDLTNADIPRMDSIFRDPRMPYLTHLTLSHFYISSEHGRLMLGYMPALTLLSLDTCSGVLELLGTLAETGEALKGFPVDRGLLSRFGVKFCPRLDSLSLLGCDVGIETLHRIVMVRNAGGAVESLSEALRHARPVKTLRRPMVGSSLTPSNSPVPLLQTGSLAGVGPASTVIPREEALRPAKIAYVRVDSITEEEAILLRKIGVEDVIWSEAT